MVDNARYRVMPPPGAYRTEPLLPPSAPGYSTYMTMLEQRERRLWWTQHRLSDMNAGRTPRPPQGAFELGHAPEELESQPSRSTGREPEFNLRQAEAAYRTYGALLRTVSPPPQDLVRAMFTNSADAGSAYSAYLNDHEDYRNGLRRLELQQTLLLAMTERARQMIDPGSRIDPYGPADTPERERLRQLMINVRSIVVRRHDELGMVFPSEAGALVSSLREIEQEQLRTAMGVPRDATPLSTSEQRAAREEPIRAVAPRLGSTADRLAQIPELRRVGAGGRITGIYRLAGYLLGYEMPREMQEINVPEARNALVGDLGPGKDDVQNLFHAPSVHHPTRRVIPLNTAAIELLQGTDVRQIRRSSLHDITLADLHP
jgi:hypothetical protein